MRPAGRKAAFGEDQHQRAEPQSLRQPRVVKPHANPRLTKGQAETEEDEQARQADPMSEPGRHDRREHHPGSGKQDKAEITHRHGRHLLPQTPAAGGHQSAPSATNSR